MDTDSTSRTAHQVLGGGYLGQGPKPFIEDFELKVQEMAEWLRSAYNLAPKTCSAVGGTWFSKPGQLRGIRLEVARNSASAAR